MKRPAPLALFAALSLTLVACGDDDGGGERAATAEQGDEFCQRAAAADNAGSAVDSALNGGDPDEMKQMFEASLDAGKTAAEVAPADIVDTVNQVIESQEALLAVFAKNDFDLTKILADEEFQTVIDTEEFQQANDELDAYLEDKCGIPSDSATDDGSGDGSTTDDTIDLGNGDVEAALDQFLSLFEIGSGTELTDEQRTCVKDALRDELTADDLSAVVNGSTTADIETAVGLAFTGCEIVVP